ncbi:MULTISPECIES: mandelate racemase/muconate lactonizing enzyme family protein [Halolamina]|uniref:o-succinylbenzoate synthase n=1 Tax=Halolamina pelagica TaxID=699431 RepID=A0A1I5MWL7_9EURY|nr:MULTISPECIES: enolase C-terminal domain-like protein [Halolamina]NHX36177.1 o-succinylbenzoate synthase [Halolamina sp. R1-12]SFP13516.1 o-succinylbenzoate synthase [Halolamina pelagica]
MSTERRPFTLDLSRPLSTADGTIEQRRGVLVGVERSADGGSVRGVGEATPLPGWTESYDACRGVLEDPPEAWEHVDDTVGAEPPSTPAARHGYRLAVLDAAARASRRSLAALLAERGGFSTPSESVAVNATVGDADAEETVAAAREAVDAGFDCLKLKLGARSLDPDLDRVRAVADAVDATIRVDANGAWDRESAAAAVDALAAIGIEYVEQPVPPEEVSALAALRGRGVDIAADESIRAYGVDAVLDAGAADVAVLKPMALGGPGAAIDAARRLVDAGVDPVVTTTIDGAVARAAAVHAAAAVPGDRACGLATGKMLASDLGTDPVPVVDGAITVPDGPGNVGGAFDDLLWD